MSSAHTFTPYFLAILTNLCFGSAALIFAYFAKLYSPFWINQLKVSVAFVGFLVAVIVSESFVSISTASTNYLLASGFVGLCIGDLFLFRAFRTLGPARTLILFSFQPFLLGIYGYFFLDQNLNAYQVTAIFCMIACVVTFIRERKKSTGSWDGLSFAYAFLGVLLDALGVMLTREAYEGSPDLGSFEANAIRAVGAIVGFFVMRPNSYQKLFLDLKILDAKKRNLALGASFIGTFVSLSLYLQALKTAHIATLTAIAITGPIWVSLIEHVRSKTWPNAYLRWALGFFIVGFILMSVGLA